MTESSEEFISGCLGCSAYGPTILLTLKSPQAVQWLRDLIIAISHGVEPVKLERQPGVRIREVSELQLRLANTPSRKRLTRIDKNRFIWSGSTDDWVTAAMLLDPFLEGRAGHQYLTDETDDVALIEVSFGEPDFPFGR